MAQVRTVVIATVDRLPALSERTRAWKAEVLTFTASDALRALDEIVTHSQDVVALERQFAETPRGVTFINRTKADPTLAESELQVVSHDSDFTRILPRSLKEPAAVAAVGLPEAEPVAAAPLDCRGTRRALRFDAPIAWAPFEIPPGRGPRYQAGVNLRGRGSMPWVPSACATSGPEGHPSSLKLQDLADRLQCSIEATPRSTLCGWPRSKRPVQAIHVRHESQTRREAGHDPRCSGDRRRYAAQPSTSPAILHLDPRARYVRRVRACGSDPGVRQHPRERRRSAQRDRRCRRVVGPFVAIETKASIGIKDNRVLERGDRPWRGHR